MGAGCDGYFHYTTLTPSHVLNVFLLTNTGGFRLNGGALGTFKRVKKSVLEGLYYSSVPP